MFECHLLSCDTVETADFEFPLKSLSSLYIYGCHYPMNGEQTCVNFAPLWSVQTEMGSSLANSSPLLFCIICYWGDPLHGYPGIVDSMTLQGPITAVVRMVTVQISLVTNLTGGIVIVTGRRIPIDSPVSEYLRQIRVAQC